MNLLMKEFLFYFGTVEEQEKIPDYAGGAVIPIAFKVNGNRLEFTLPSLKYWNMLVVEYK